MTIMSLCNVHSGALHVNPRIYFRSKWNGFSVNVFFFCSCCCIDSHMLHSFIHSKSQIKWASDSFYRFICLHNNLCMWFLLLLLVFNRCWIWYRAQARTNVSMCIFFVVLFFCFFTEMLTQLYLIYYLILMQSMKNNN